LNKIALDRKTNKKISW